MKTDEVKKPKHEILKDSSQGEVSAVRNNDRQADFKTEAANFEKGQSADLILCTNMACARAVLAARKKIA